MLEAGYFWMGVFTAAALVFFGIAAVVAWKGFEDLRELLSSSDENNAEEFPGKEIKP